MTKLTFITILSLLTLNTLLAPSSAGAANENLLESLLEPPQLNFQMGPIVNDLELEAGEEKEAILAVVNLSEYEATVEISAQPFTLKGDTGEIRFSNELVSPLTDWLTISRKSASLFPGEKQLIPIHIQIPAEPEPGSHYLAVAGKFKTLAPYSRLGEPQDQAQTKFVSQIACLFLVTIKGEVDRPGELATFEIPKTVWQGPVPMKLEIANRGNSHFYAVGQVTIKNLLTQSTEKITLPTAAILPGKTRKLNLTWEKAFPLGFFKVTAFIIDGEEQTSIEERTIVAIPWLPLTVVFLVILALIIFFKHYRITPKPSHRTSP